MRTGGYTLQHSLTAEATTVVKQAVTLARRRGHAQVTPLHVASVMLASSTGLFRRACLQAHSHPLQCKALELCFNVALNRLPTTSTSSPIPILGPHHHHHHSHHLPSLSNALIAAFKRAQAHQRRGSLENQQQPILALKVEIEQLVISILDDPSVSRVMREAGFSSTQVKTKVEQAVSSSMTETAADRQESKESAAVKPPPLVLGNYVPQTFKLSLGRTAEQVRDDDVMSIVGAMMNKKTKNTVIVGECPSTAESVVKGVIEKFDTGNVPGDMKHVQFISVPLFTLRNISREEFEEKLGELRSLVKSYLSRGVVLYLGDLRWVSDFWSKYCEQRIIKSQYYNVYSPVEHMIMELSRLLCGIGDSSSTAAGGGKLWIMGIATFNTYMKCKTGRPSLETLWDLHPLTIPVGSLALSLNLDSDLNNQFMMRSKGVMVEGSSSWLHSCNKARAEKYLSCCADCLANFNKEARSVTRNNNLEATGSVHGSSSLPSWLQQYKEEKQRETIEHDQEFEKIRDLCTKWNSVCKSVHSKQPDGHFLMTDIKVPKCASASPCSSASVSSSTDLQPGSKLTMNHNHHQSLLKLPLIFEQPSSQPPSYKERKFFAFESEYSKPDTKPDLLSNPNSSPNSASSSEASGDTDLRLPLEEEALCSALEKNVPWQKDLIREIVSTILQCRSGKSNKICKMNCHGKEREDTWLSFLGSDSEGKDKIGRELAKSVFGPSQGNFVPIGISSFSSTTGGTHHDHDSIEEVISNNKRPRDEGGMSYFERFGVAVRENPRRVFFLEDFDQIDYHSRKRFKKAMESGSLDLSSLPAAGDDEPSALVLLKDAIVIFNSEERVLLRNNNGSDDHKLEENRTLVTSSLDLNVATAEDEDDENSVSENGILDSVDKKVMFKLNASHLN